MPPTEPVHILPGILVLARGPVQVWTLLSAFSCVSSVLPRLSVLARLKEALAL